MSNGHKATDYVFLADDDALKNFLRAWEAGTLPKPQWTHAAHVAVSACYAYACEPEEAFERLKRGVIHYNTSVGTVNSDTSGYHETLTRFWSGLICEHLRGGQFPSRLEAARSAVAEFGEDRARLTSYYSFDWLKDVRARREWVLPDREPD